MGKQCINCSVDLVLGENIPPSRWKRSWYQCRSCNSKFDGKRKNRDDYNEYMREYNRNRPQHRNAVDKNKKSINPGVYGVYNDGELIYIGQSKIPYDRMTKHFSKSKKYVYSSVSQALSNGELQRDNLVFKMLEFIDDHKARLNREQALIQQHTPLYNSDMYRHIQ